MAIGKRLLMYSKSDAKASSLVGATADWGCLVTTCDTQDDLRGRIEGGNYDVVLVDDSAVLRQLVAEAEPNGSVLKLTLAEVEKRHILRVLHAANGNKTRAAKTLGIDTKTLYNKLKSYTSTVAKRPRRVTDPADEASEGRDHPQQSDAV